MLRRSADRTGRAARAGGGTGGADPAGLLVVRRAGIPRGPTAEERELLWKGREERLRRGGPGESDFYVQDGVVPRTKIASTLHFIAEVARHSGLTISNIFMRGTETCTRSSCSIREGGGFGESARRRRGDPGVCIEAGGTITGEHGVGMEKNELMAKPVPAGDARHDARSEAAVRPRWQLNPGKMLPTGRGCLEIRQQPLTAGSQLL